MKENEYKVCLTKKKRVRDSEVYDMLDDFINMEFLESSIEFLEYSLKNATKFSIKFEEINQELEVYFKDELHRGWMLNLIKNKIRYLKSILEERKKDYERHSNN